MFLFVKQTLIRGRSFVPWIFLRTRQWRLCASLCFFSVLIAKSCSVLLRLTGPSCLPCGRRAHLCIAHPCLYTAPADRSCEFQQQPVRRPADPGPRWSVSYFPRRSL